MDKFKLKNIVLVIAALLVLVPLAYIGVSHLVDVARSLPNGAWDAYTEGRLSLGEIFDPKGNPFAHRFTDLKDIRATTIVVTGSDARNRYDSDLRCDGANDELQLQAAYDALTSGRTRKEKVVAIGDFNCAASLNVPSYSIFELQGVITYSNADGSHLFTFSAVEYRQEIEIRGGKLVGQATSGQAIYFSWVSDCTIDNIEITGFTNTDGNTAVIYMNGGGSGYRGNNKITNNFIHNNYIGAMMLNSYYSEASGNKFVDNPPTGTAGVNGNLYWTGSCYGIISNNRSLGTVAATENIYRGIFIYNGADHNSIIGNVVNCGDVGIDINLNCDYNIISGNQVSRIRTWENTECVGIWQTCHHNTVIGNNFGPHVGGNTGDHVQISAGCQYNEILYNTCDPPGYISNSSDDTNRILGNSARQRFNRAVWGIDTDMAYHMGITSDSVANRLLVSRVEISEFGQITKIAVFPGLCVNGNIKAVVYDSDGSYLPNNIVCSSAAVAVNTLTNNRPNWLTPSTTPWVNPGIYYVGVACDTVYAAGVSGMQFRLSQNYGPRLDMTGPTFREEAAYAALPDPMTEIEFTAGSYSLFGLKMEVWR